ncbi:MarR family transcriptional regulator [Sphingobium sp. DEHP117]|uniref:MarR family winged helix-turn-helix transcriptional regulator n=1 Tax=Sphingobium sp. DEHP117 TaxID=2993436 RepID=UPI0027D75FE5|nr:MarR family transcriptional regulator [Sphingobium sp. DEHP117]MDQ4421187.1 MarR family transcriptional regulator [Sphingobium sp. DEHP117]
MWLMESNLAFLCYDIGRLFRKRFGELARQTGPTGTQWRALLVVQRYPGINQGMLAEHLDVEPITACRMVDRLEQANLVERRRDPNDRRAWTLYLTDAAVPAVNDLKAHGLKVLEWMTSDLTREEVEMLGRYLTRIREKFATADDTSGYLEAHNG